APAADHDQDDQPQATPQAAIDWRAMDAMHEAGVKAFPAKTVGEANQPLPFTRDGDVKVFTLEAKVVKWQVTPTITVDAWTYNGTMPGPIIRVTEGDRMRVVVTNNLPESTAVHWHGLMLPYKMDGVPFITQPPITPGETFTYEFVAKNPGSHMYHAHNNSTKQVGKGLLGALIVEPKEPTYYAISDYAREYVMILNDANGGFTLNGKGFPATAPLTAKIGEKILIRYMNEGAQIHPMHLHGFPQTVIAKDGWPQQPWKCDTLNVAPGERWDVIVEPDEPGVWAFHCHILSHAEGEHGMFGMVTALVVEDPKAEGREPWAALAQQSQPYYCKV
ncbi:MAG: multicopper oxidase domain-containing protein, partial [Chloroflexales bacterium]|nr:multicopper oxidase domain-containing protein [Chloroflexales bacterium]